jgi:adenylate cyclase
MRRERGALEPVAGTLSRTIARAWQRAASRTGVRRLRLACGLTLFTYVSLHLLDHALNNISVATAEDGMLLQKALWQGWLGGMVLYGALGTHMLLGLWAFYERRHFGWTGAEVAQVALGLSIPPLLCNHVYVTRVSLELFGTQKGYAQEFLSFWVKSPELGVQQMVVLIVAWLHGCIGVYFWLRLKPWFARAMPALLCAAVLLPVLALLGFYQGGRTVLALAGDPAWQAANAAPWQVGLPAQNAALHAWRQETNAVFAALFLLALGARGVRALRERRGGTIRVTYPGGQVARVPRGFSVLEASRSARVPHASVCGGRARCSTCRVRVIGAAAALPPPSAGERAVLARSDVRGAVRLACQLRPTGDISVVPLLPAGSAAIRRRPPATPWPGEERFIVVLVADMRDSMRLAATRMPFDAVFVIDRFITAIAGAVIAAGGRANHFTGDGLISAFGLTCPPREACRQALAAVAGIGRNVEALNRALLGEMAEPIRFGLGVHGSVAVVGEIGFAETRVLTTLGDPANIASRLEQLCKTFHCEAVLSEPVCRLSGLALGDLPLVQAEVRGRPAPLAVRTVARAAALMEAAG